MPIFNLAFYSGGDGDDDYPDPPTEGEGGIDDHDDTPD